MALTLANHKYTSLGNLKMLTGTYTTGTDEYVPAPATLTVEGGRVYLAQLRSSIQGDAGNVALLNSYVVSDSVSGGLTTLTIHAANKDVDDDGRFIVIYK